MNKLPHYKIKDLRGKIFNKLTVIEFSHYNKRRQTFWICRCECGTVKPVAGCGLVNGMIKSCGCLKRTDVTGQKFGRLTVESLNSIRKGASYWNCLCDCGKSKTISRSSLTSGATISCGCYQLEKLAKNREKHKREDLTGKKFGRLTVTEFDQIKKISNTNRPSFWFCKCDCGNELSLNSSSLKTGNTQSCGCYNLEMSLLRTGEKHPCWNPDLTKEEREMDRNLLPEYKLWRKEVLKRDRWTCQISGIQRNLRVHHIENWAANKELRLVIENGITLNVGIHKLFHKAYGNRKNTKEQFLEFKSRYNSGEWLDYQI